GKAHSVFQSALLGDPPAADKSVIWAKANRNSIFYSRKGFRHELASALAMLKHGLPDLAAYLAAAHHGKVRLSIRSLPHEKAPGDPSIKFARGIWDGDILPVADLGCGTTLLETVLDLSCMEFGEGQSGPSWLGRMIALRDDNTLGPFRIAFLEALLRVADWRASQALEKSDA
ncbi:MAG: CRISPR-associated helicase/endonuclease Cas3, partial [Proteobacteria bacterium]|nr:CRISPR-associated helicase/endonuclease Cas3 [Pseudomonadota bacterium]